jgi:hypothetical protein
MLRSKPRFALLASVLLATVAPLALTGCDSGPETYAYQSDTYSPKTITVLDTSTGEKILAVDVPPGQQLNRKFESTRQAAEKTGKDTLRWNLRPWGDSSLEKSSTLQVPPPSSRRIDMTLRPAPEPRPLGGN